MAQDYAELTISKGELDHPEYLANRLIQCIKDNPGAIEIDVILEWRSPGRKGVTSKNVRDSL